MALSRTFLLVLVVLHGTIEGYQQDNKSTPSSINKNSAGLQQNGLKQGGGCPFQLQKTMPDPDLTCGPTPKFCTKSRYRSLDGSCNNLQRPNWGAATTPYVRLTKNHYADGIHKMPTSVTGGQLPNARELSFRIFLNKRILSPEYSLNAGQWGQIITHDMSLTAGDPQISPPQKCCNQGHLTKVANNSSTCAAILVPPNDPIYRVEERQCLDFVRTQTTKDIGCTAADAPAQQITAVTAFMDLSLVYGNNINETDSLRTKRGGKMLTLIRNGQEWPPQEPNATNVCVTKSNNEPCYVAGDIRVNQNLQLTALQVILLRNHNHIAGQLAYLNPNWNDQTLFQEARRIHIAQIQHINFYEYLPYFLGFDNMVRKNLIYPEALSYVNDYDPNVNPSIINEHATAAFRHFHTLIRGFLKRVSKNRQLAGVVRLSDWLNKPSLLEVNNTFEELTRGLTVQKMSVSDQYWTDELTDFLFKGNRTFGDDLRAIDIQRGRDHGLGSYVSTRAACKLPVPKTFHDMRDYISEKFSTLKNKNAGTLRDISAYTFECDLRVGDVDGEVTSYHRAITVRTYPSASHYSVQWQSLKPLSVDHTHMINTIPNVALLQDLYASPQDVDLVVAGSLERHVPGAMVGPTFLCILTEQFYRTRVGDRYFYENGADPDIAFTPAQLQAIRKGANMARLLCDNTKGIHHMQRKAFKLVSKTNPILPCDQLPFIDLTQWRE